MFFQTKAYKLKKLAERTDKFFQESHVLLLRYNTIVDIRKEANHHIVHRNEFGVESISAYAMECTVREFEGKDVITRLDRITICMNSIYMIAKATHRPPVEVLEITLTIITKSIVDGVFYEIPGIRKTNSVA